jgi:uncharacterized LabA/DUF88 family protein
MERVIAYVDGFNLYFGLKAAQFERFLWLDVEQLVRELVNPRTQVVSRTRYFTTRVSDPPPKVARQTTYLEALQAHRPALSVHFGHYLSSIRTCKKCGHAYTVQSEKMTDVNIASELLHDLFNDAFDVAFIVSADSDLATPIQKTLVIAPHKRVVVVFPPRRKSNHLRQIASGTIDIKPFHLSMAQLPDPVVRRSDGFLLRRPLPWA